MISLKKLYDQGYRKFEFSDGVVREVVEERRSGPFSFPFPVQNDPDCPIWYEDNGKNNIGSSEFPDVIGVADMITIELDEYEVDYMKEAIRRYATGSAEARSISRKIQPKTYKVGQRFQLRETNSLFHNQTYVLTIKKPHMEINLFDENSGELWSGRCVTVKDQHNITEEEFQTLVVGRNFVEI